MNEKKALLAVSFGTSHSETCEKNIAAVERDLAAALPKRHMVRAFTSGMILRILERRDGQRPDDVPEALARLAMEGYSDVLLQPTHIICGDEYQKLLDQATPFQRRFIQLRVGRPLLTKLEDYPALAHALMTELEPPAEDEALLFMGHGTTHSSNSAYCQLEYVLQEKGWSRALVATVEGYPTLDEVLRRLAQRATVRRVRLHPLMLVAGDHAQNDMAGPSPDSWRARLEAAGYSVTCCMRGLGEYPAVRQRFAAHALEAEGAN